MMYRFQKKYSALEAADILQNLDDDFDEDFLSGIATKIGMPSVPDVGDATGADETISLLPPTDPVADETTPPPARASLVMQTTTPPPTCEPI